MPQPRVVVVTGASAGLGRAIARAFGARGAAVGLIARGQERLPSAEAEIRDAGGRALAILADVSDAAALEAAAERVDRELGPIDVWINNAMVSVFSPVKEMTAEEFRRVTEVTYLGYVHGSLAALRRMLSRDAGTIVQVSSSLAFRGIPLQSAYCASKHAIKGFTEALRTELLHDGSAVRVTMVHMPALNTPQFDWVRTGCRTGHSRCRRCSSRKSARRRWCTRCSTPSAGISRSADRRSRSPGPNGSLPD